MLQAALEEEMIKLLTVKRKKYKNSLNIFHLWIEETQFA